VLRRADREIQIGLDPRGATIFCDLPQSVADAACRLDGRSDAGHLLGRLPPADRPALRSLLGELAGRGILLDGPPSSAQPRRLVPDVAAWVLRAGRDGRRRVAGRADHAVAVHGDGRLAVAVATMLASAGIGRVDVVANGTVHPGDVGCGYLAGDVGRPRRAAARDAVRRGDPTARTDRVPTRAADLVLLTDALVPAPELTGALRTDAVPHLAVRARDAIGIVGPLVIAGRSSCLTCADLRRADLDPCWPLVAAQVAGEPQASDLTCTQATAAVAAQQALRALAWLASGGRRPPTWNTTIEIDTYLGTIGHRRWPPHPRCVCGAPQDHREGGAHATEFRNGCGNRSARERITP